MSVSVIRRVLFGLVLVALAGPSLAQTYDEGLRAYDAGDYAKAVEIWGPLAEGGHAVSQYSLGKLLENGGGTVAKDYVEAAKWYERAANQSIAAARNNLGLMYAQGRGVPRDVARAAQLWHAAAESDHAIAQFNLGLAYFRGEGVEPDRAAAERWFRRAGKLGLADAQYALGQILRMGLSSAADEAEALRWYELAAAQGHAKARVQAAELRKGGVQPSSAAASAPAPTDTAPGQTAAVPRPAESEAGPAAPQARAAAPEPAVSEPAAEVPEPTAKAPEPAPAAAPEPAPAETAATAPEPAPAETPVAAQGAMAEPATGPYRVWLLSTKAEAEAARHLEAVAAKHPEIFSEVRGAVDVAEFGKGRRYHRVVAGALPSREAARALCRRLRAAQPGAFCKVLAN